MYQRCKTEPNIALCTDRMGLNDTNYYILYFALQDGAYAQIALCVLVMPTLILSMGNQCAVKDSSFAH